MLFTVCSITRSFEMANFQANLTSFLLSILVFIILGKSASGTPYESVSDGDETTFTAEENAIFKEKIGDELRQFRKDFLLGHIIGNLTCLTGIFSSHLQECADKLERSVAILRKHHCTNAYEYRECMINKACNQCVQNLDDEEKCDAELEKEVFVLCRPHRAISIGRLLFPALFAILSFIICASIILLFCYSVRFQTLSYL